MTPPPDVTDGIRELVEGRDGDDEKLISQLCDLLARAREEDEREKAALKWNADNGWDQAEVNRAEIVRLDSEVAALRLERDELKADRDSWYQQCEMSRENELRLGRERDEALKLLKKRADKQRYSAQVTKTVRAREAEAKSYRKLFASAESRERGLLEALSNEKKENQQLRERIDALALELATAKRDAKAGFSTLDY